MRKKIIKVPIYNGNLVLIETEDFKPIEKKYNLSNTSTYNAFVFAKDGKNTIEYIMVFRPETIDPGVIVHESVHIVNELFYNKGIKPDLLNDEPQAYLLQWVFEQAMKFYIKK